MEKLALGLSLISLLPVVLFCVISYGQSVWSEFRKGRYRFGFLKLVHERKQQYLVRRNHDHHDNSFNNAG